MYKVHTYVKWQHGVIAAATQLVLVLNLGLGL